MRVLLLGGKSSLRIFTQPLPFLQDVRNVWSESDCWFHTQFKDLVTATVADLYTLSSAKHVDLYLSIDTKDNYRPFGEQVRVGRESTRHQFNFVPVDYPELRSVIDNKTIREFYKPIVRYNKYCPRVLSRPSPSPSSNPSVAADCRAVQSKKQRLLCQMELERLCQRRENEADYKTDIPSLGKLCARVSPVNPWPWKTTRNCSALRLRSDRRLCKREKRKRCRKNVMKKNPGMRSTEAVAQCKAKQAKDRCVRKVRRKNKKLSKKKAMKMCKKKSGRAKMHKDKSGAMKFKVFSIFDFA